MFVVSTRNYAHETKISIISLFLETFEGKSPRIRRGEVEPLFEPFAETRIRNLIVDFGQESARWNSSSIFYLFPGTSSRHGGACEKTTERSFEPTPVEYREFGIFCSTTRGFEYICENGTSLVVD